MLEAIFVGAYLLKSVSYSTWTPVMSCVSKNRPW